MSNAGSIVEQTHRLVRSVSGSCRPHVVYLRRKPGRGMVVRYATTDAASRSWTAIVPDSVFEQRLEPFEDVIESGVPVVSGVTCVPFPCDPMLPALAAALDLSSQDASWRLLSAALRTVLDDPAAVLVATTARCVRYKPGERCVLRYELEGLDRAGAVHRASVYGKMFADRDDAIRTWDVACRLHRASDRQRPPVPRPLVPRPLVIDEAMSIVVTASAGVDARSGIDVLSPARACESDLTATGELLAWLHSVTEKPAVATRPMSALIDQTRRRAALLGTTHDALASELCRVADAVITTLSGSGEPNITVLLHGAFKPSQLVFVAGHPVMTDLDGATFGDPAHDLGYLRAYLRPPGCWTRRAAPRDWYAAARAVVTTAYVDAFNRVIGVGVDRELCRRAVAVEAAVLFKIAARRVNRLQAPRPTEVRAMLADVERCLAEAGA